MRIIDACKGLRTLILTRSYSRRYSSSVAQGYDLRRLIMTRYTLHQRPDLSDLQNQLTRIFQPFARFANGEDEDLVSGTWVPPVDVAETKEKILVRAEVPGLKQEDIQIEFENGLL